MGVIKKNCQQFSHLPPLVSITITPFLEGSIKIN